jgi:hypothetical protein
VDKVWMNPFHWCQDSVLTIDRDLSEPSDHFGILGILTTRS